MTTPGPLAVPAGAVVYVHGDISAPYDPTADQVDAALVLLGSGDPQDADWQTAGWQPGTTATARVLIGPGTTLDLAAGTYRLWFRVHDSPETPELDSGLVIIF